MSTLWGGCNVVPEEFLHFLSDGELSALLVKLSVKVREGVRGSVNHVTRPVRLHAYRILKLMGTTQKIRSFISLSCCL